MGQMNSSSKSMSTSTKCNSGAGNSYEEYEKLRKKANENPKQMTDSDWQNLLDKQTYYVTREKGVILKNVTPAFVYVFFRIISSTLIKDAKPNKVCDTHIFYMIPNKTL